ncbi:MAG: 1-deoxy-D-xylulose-5-phosphate synthase [Planctomycetota bacterium]
MAHQPRIMYIEYKGDGLAGTARIGRVEYSKTGSTLYYAGKQFRSLKGGYKANFYDVETGENYWISGCKKAGGDRLYPGEIEIDEDVREEYWIEIRECPERIGERTIRCTGKYNRRSPR